MRHGLTSISAAILSVTLAGCAANQDSAESSGPRQGTSASRAAIAKRLAKLDDDWSAAAATRDANRVASFYADDAIVYPPNEPVAVGRAAAQRVWAAYFAEPSFRISWKTLHAEAAASGDIGYTSGTYEATYNGPGGTPVIEKGKYLCTWKVQSDGAWKAVHDMWNTDAK